MGFLDDEGLRERAEALAKSGYGAYLLALLEEQAWRTVEVRARAATRLQVGEPDDQSTTGSRDAPPWIQG